MSLRHAILASLAKSEATGYEITKQFEGQLGFFWQASHQQIYRELAKLSEDELVEYSVVTQYNKPDKKRYELTDKGEDELLDWLKKPAKLPKINDSLSVKVMAGYLQDVETLVKHIGHQKELHQNKLKKLTRFEQNNFVNKTRLSRTKKLMYLTVKKQILAEEAWLSWAEEALELLSAH